MRRARIEAAEAEILDVLFFKTGKDVCYLSFADALQQADWLIRNAHITWPLQPIHNIWAASRLCPSQSLYISNKVALLEYESPSNT